MVSKSRDKSKLSKNEVAPNFVRDWVEFENPANPEELFKCDLTWLTSYWQCIYGNGCCGIDGDKPDAGCCSDGAYYTGKEDEKRVFEAAKKLTRADWQFYDQARPKKSGGKLQITEIGLDKDRKTKKVKDSCIFLNRVGYEAPGYTGSFGCALHHLAIKEQVHFVDTKPEGGADFDWYCTSNSEAHVGRVPVYQSSEVELTKMMGPKGYAELVKLCDSRMAAISATRKAQKKRELPLFVIHPATKAAQEGR